MIPPRTPSPRRWIRGHNLKYSAVGFLRVARHNNCDIVDVPQRRRKGKDIGAPFQEVGVVEEVQDRRHGRALGDSSGDHVVLFVIW